MLELFSLLLLFGLYAAGVFFVLFFRSYIKKKAENFATKQDIKGIAQTQEKIKSDYAHVLERYRTESQLRLAVVERRFEAHQEAYTLWRDLLSAVHSEEENPKAVMKCNDWLRKRGLYLDADPRYAFARAFSAANNHPMLLRGRGSGTTSDDIMRNWDMIMAAGPAIEEAVSLPKLGTDILIDKPSAEPN